MRPLSIHLSVTALQHNLQVIRQAAGKRQICAVVKANAYGHRYDKIIPLLSSVDYLAVCSVTEALQVRQWEAHTPIILLEGVFNAQEYDACVRYNFWPVIHHLQQLVWLRQSQHVLTDVILKINTGMNRLGLERTDLESVMLNIPAKRVHLLSHLACADMPSHALNGHQIEKFLALPKSSGWRSLMNSAGTFALPAIDDVVRVGLALYGISPFDEDHKVSMQALQPVMRLLSKLIAVQTLQAGDYVGYGATYVAKAAMRLGIVACGYADGYPREVSQDAYVLVAGIKAPIVGRISMDMLAVDLSLCPEATIGSSVELFGEHLPVAMLSRWANTIPYTLLTRITDRVHFQLIE